MKITDVLVESSQPVDENLRDWFKEKWVRFGPDGKIRGDCARGDDSEGKPKCLPQSKAHSLGKKGRASAAARKRREDPDPERSGKAINVNTKKKTNEQELDEACWKGYHKEGNKKMFGKTYPNCVKNTNEEQEHHSESCPHCGGEMVSEELMNEKKDACYYKVKSRYKVWPSAYASGALVKCRKKGASNWGTGGKSNESVSEAGTRNADKIRRIQHMLNKKFNANLDIDGVLGPLTLQSIKKFLPAKSSGPAPYPDRTTAVQGNKIKSEDQNMKFKDITHGVEESAPPGAKAERMVKHIKAGYAKDGKLTDVEKRKAFGAAWKAHNKGIAEGFNGEYNDEAGMADNNLETLKRTVEGIDDLIDSGDNLPEWCQEKIAVAKSMLVAVWDYMYSEEASDEVDPEVDEMFEAMDQLAEQLAAKHQVSADTVWESFEALDDRILYETAAWRRKEGKSKTGGLNAKGVASYRRENPGSKLQTAVTTKPSKLKPGSKAAKRRKSFCARMSGVKGPMKKPNGKPTRKALALRKWNC